MDFSARLAGLKILARFENTGLGFSVRAELRPGLNPSPCNRQLGFLRICFRSRSEISARGETHHVIGPLIILVIFYNRFSVVRTIYTRFRVLCKTRTYKWYSSRPI